MDSYTETVPLSILDGSDGDLEVTFEWKAGLPAYGEVDMGSGDDFNIVGAHYSSLPEVPVGLGLFEQETIIDWLTDNWERPDLDDEEADYRYEQQRDERMEQRND